MSTSVQGRRGDRKAIKRVQWKYLLLCRTVSSRVRGRDRVTRGKERKGVVEWPRVSNASSLIPFDPDMIGEKSV